MVLRTYGRWRADGRSRMDEGAGYRSALAKLRRSIAPVPEALMPRATMLTSQPSAWARSAPTLQFSLPRTENGSYL